MQPHGGRGADVRQHRGARPRLGRRRQRGAEANGLGRSRGGYSTKIHLKTDFDGRPIAFEITGGEKADAPMFETLPHLGPDAAPRAVVADKGFDSRANRAAARACGAVPVIPHKVDAAAPVKHFARALYRGRARIEQAVGKLKRLKRIALRCEKTKANFATFTALAIGSILVQFVHTA
ncbi:IS5 family transposase [Rubrimonas sp.]|uniref:IS5 family transposase n=1 Tax=Rubrimonas sp. TaxID=2036015 RepID=UPI002FDE9AF4